MERLEGIAKSQNDVRPAPETNGEGDSMLIENVDSTFWPWPEEGRVRMRTLSESLGISQITIRKDLDYLEEKGLLERSHGGALPIQSSALFDPTLQEKERAITLKRGESERPLQGWCRKVIA